MKMQPRFSFSVDSLLGRKTNGADIKSECLGGSFTRLDTEDRSHTTGQWCGYLIKYFSSDSKLFLLQIIPIFG